MFANRVTTSQGSIQVLRNAWNLVASGVMLLLKVFLCTVYLCVLAVPMSVMIRMYICIRYCPLSGTSSPALSVVLPPAGMMWTTVWPPL